MKKPILSFILLFGAMSGSICLHAKKRTWQERAKEAAIYEKDVWTKGLPAFIQNILYEIASNEDRRDIRKLTDEEVRLAFSLLQRVLGISALGFLLSKEYLRTRRIREDLYEQLRNLGISNPEQNFSNYSTEELWNYLRALQTAPTPHSIGKLEFD